MKIAYIAVKGIPIGGGIEKLTEEIGSRLVKKGHQIIVYSSRDYQTVSGEFRGMKIKTVPSINTKSLHKLSICFNAVFDVLLKDNIDLVHFHAVGPSLFAIFPRFKRIPTVVQTHGLEWKRDKWGGIAKAFFKLADYSAIYFPNKTTSVSRVQKEYYEHKFGREIIYIPTGVNSVKKRKPRWILEQNLEPDRYVFFAGRLVKEKGAHYLIEAFRNIQTDMRLVVAGDAAYSEKYKVSLKKKAKGDIRIIFPGFVTGSRLEELFSNAYLFCLPSTLEGLPIALLEAMSYGNCCLVSDIPENIEVMEQYGYTFKSRNIDDLRKVLRSLIENPDRVTLKKQSSAKHVLQKYSWDKISDDMEAFYQSVIGM
jgi:glycosyltransferase involved in cell wall biosynthesis